MLFCQNIAHTQHCRITILLCSRSIWGQFWTDLVLGRWGNIPFWVKKIPISFQQITLLVLRNKYVYVPTVMRTQKEVPLGQSSKTKRKNKRFSFNNLCQPCTPRVAPVSPEPASPPVTPVFLYDRNIPGFPYRSPTAQLTNLERAQLEHFENQLPTLDV